MSISGDGHDVATPSVLYCEKSSQEQQAAAKQAGPPVEDHRTHNDEIFTAHQGAPTVAVQSRTHGAPLPAEDHGYPSDQAKYA